MQNHCVQPMHPYKLVPSQDGSAQAYNRPWTGGIAGGAAAVRTTAPALPATVDSRPAPGSGLGSDGEGDALPILYVYPPAVNETRGP